MSRRKKQISSDSVKIIESFLNSLVHSETKYIDDMSPNVHFGDIFIFFARSNDGPN